MSSSPVLLKRSGQLAILMLDRPDRANVLDLAMSEALIDAIAQVANDVAQGAVRAVLVRANGRQFCAGGDIADFVTARGRLAEFLDRHIPPLHRAIHTLATLPVPVVSALNGPIGGGGIGLALAADIVIAAESMKLRGGYSAIGLTPDAGGSWFLARRVGAARAKEIFLTNEVLSARECLAIGAVSRVVADADLQAQALALAETLARNATASLGRIKTLFDGVARRTLKEQLDLEHQCMVASGLTADATEGTSAFAEKRGPVFTGR